MPNTNIFSHWIFLMLLLFQKNSGKFKAALEKFSLVHLLKQNKPPATSKLYQVILSHHSSEHFLLNLKFHLPEVKSARSGIFYPLNMRQYMLYCSKLSKLLIRLVAKAKNKQQPKTTFWILVVWSLPPLLLISYRYFPSFLCFLICYILEMAV